MCPSIYLLSINYLSIVLSVCGSSQSSNHSFSFHLLLFSLFFSAPLSISYLSTIPLSACMPVELPISLIFLFCLLSFFFFHFFPAPLSISYLLTLYLSACLSLEFPIHPLIFPLFRLFQLISLFSRFCLSIDLLSVGYLSIELSICRASCPSIHPSSSISFTSPF